MHAQGLDRAGAPQPAMARQMLDKIGGRWWNVYIGGPESGGSGWTPELVREYVRHGIDRFMLTYVGRQSRGPLTPAQGRADGLEAMRLAKAFGYSGDFPLCLDVEGPTYTHAPAPTTAYARAWCATVRDAGARPGVYSNPAPLEGMAAKKVPAEFVWVAKWVSHGAAPHDPHDIPGFPAALWSKEGARAWQYAGAFGNEPCRVLGFDVDIDVADLGCLAGPPGHQGAGGRARPMLLRRGARGRPVVRLTRRLSAVHPPSAGAPYLDGPRRRYDARVERAVKAFQRDEQLDSDGIFGRQTARALARAGRRQRQAAAHSPSGANGSSGSVAKKPGHTAKPGTPATQAPASRRAPRVVSLRGLVDDVRRLDAETECAWQRLVDYGEGRREAAGAGADAAEERALGEIAQILKRMELTLETLVAVEREELAVERAEAIAESESDGGKTSVAKAPAPSASARRRSAAAATVDAPPAAGGGPGAEEAAAGNGGAGAGAALASVAAPAREPLALEQLGDEELEERVERLRRAANRSRAELIRRYAAAELQAGAGRVAPARERPVRRRAPAERQAQPPATHKPSTPAHERRRQPARELPPPRERAVEPHVRDLQTALNRFSEKYLQGMAPLIVDGKRGPATNKRIRQVKYYLGYSKADRRSTSADPDLLRRMSHPHSPRVSGPRMLARANARRRKQRKAAQAAAAPRAGVATFDGKPVAAWLVPYLQWARANGWQGQLNSGYRTPEYSEHLCMGICGAVRCPGRCAGRSSNHTQRVKPQGALDVTDYVRFGELMKRCPHSPRIFNNLPADRVHFSSTGG